MTTGLEATAGDIVVNLEGLVKMRFEVDLGSDCRVPLFRVDAGGPFRPCCPDENEYALGTIIVEIALSLPIVGGYRWTLRQPTFS